jgi:hypothetical protein
MMNRSKTVNFETYGKFSKYFDGKHIAVFDIKVDQVMTLGDLLERIKDSNG